MALNRKDTPLANTPDPVFSQIDKSRTSLVKSDGTSLTQLTVQKDKDNGKQKFKQWSVTRDEEGTPTAMQIQRTTNTGNDRIRMITNANKIERKLDRVLKRNE